MAERMLVQLARLRRDGKTQMRTAMDAGWVAELQELFGGSPKAAWPDDLEPGRAYQDAASNLWLADGFHRYAAAEAAGLTEVPVYVFEGTIRDALKFACGANETHGKRRTAADREKAVKTLLDDPEWSNFSVARIAEVCRLTWRTADKIVKSIGRKTESVRVERNGSSYDLRPSGGRPAKPGESSYARAEDAPEEPNQEEPPNTGHEDEPEPGPIADEPPNDRDGPPIEVVKDCLGIVCQSEAARQAFAAVTRFDELESRLRADARLVSDLAQLPGAEVYRQKLGMERGSKGKDRFRSRHLTDALTELEFHRPYCTICPYCYDKIKTNQNTCEACKGLPYVTKQAFDNAPKEMRSAVQSLVEENGR